MEETYKGFEINFINDEYPLNPREDFDNFGHLVGWHKRYALCDTDLREFSVEEFKKFMSENKGGIFLPVYMYDHSGISLSCDYVYPYNDRWDAGQVGFIYATAEDMRKEFNVKRITKAVREKAEEILRQEIKTFSAYVSGDVWGYSIIDPETNDSISDCFGFYGYYEEKDYMIKEAKSEIDAYLQNIEADKWEKFTGQPLVA